MDFTYVEFPSTVNFNTFKAYYELHKCKLPNIHGRALNQTEGLETNTNQIKTLRHLVLDTILDNWSYNPIFKEIEHQEDRNYILSNLNVNLPLKILSSYIQDDFFWRKSYQHRWKSAVVKEKCKKTKPWINIYMERHLQEFIENLTTTDYDQERVQVTLDICAMYINQLEINYLQPSMDGQNDHIPLDFILRNLPELHTLRLTYCTKTIGTHYYLGCNMLSRRDASLLARGLQQCHELVNFCLHNTKLEPYQLGLFAYSLDKGCHYLSALSLEHCSLGDEGIREFLSSCNKESFGTLKYLDLTNNKITSEGAYYLSKVLKSLSLEKLILRLNPIGSEGAASIFAALDGLPLTDLDMAGCSLDDTITKLFMQLIIQNKTLWSIDISNNCLGQDFGKHLFKVIGFNKTLKRMNLRNTGVSLDMCKQFQEILKESHLKKK
ncbi:dynein regulatory complex subunit 5-like [Lucilia sericata]|uniref:dynein regulatory complex subunit 5-like n=1 Tax=Lucilia sericata TaxID=13632 RepID=UPI0018A8336E|nr:dynein regulatory complex subunit 5-like [Lucilia sericata]